jgi:hypothetical protein
MSNRMRFRLSLCLTLCALCALGAEAQTQLEWLRRTPPVTASATAEQVRFVALPGVCQMRLEVFAAYGTSIFDSAIKSGNLFDWGLRDQYGQPLADGAYLCVITVKDFAGRSSQQRGVVLLQAGQVALLPLEQAESSIRELSARLPGERSEPLAGLPSGAGLASALLAHDGASGRLVSSSGGLSFRTGDFFAGRDQEQMRLTAEGNLGLGVANPQTRLDVGGLIRTSEGIVFPDGSIQTTAAIMPGRAVVGRDGLKRDAHSRSLAAAGAPDKQAEPAKEARLAPSISGSGTTNRVTKWTDGPAGVVGDSVISEVNGNIGIGTTSPQTGLDYRNSLAPFLTRDIGPNNALTAQSALQLGLSNAGSRFAGVGPSLLFFAENSAGNKSFLGRVSSVWENPTAGQEAGALFFQVRANSGDVSALTERMRITSGGTVGIGITNPNINYKLHVSNTNHATRSDSTDGIGLYGFGLNNMGVKGESFRGVGVLGESTVGLAGIFRYPGLGAPNSLNGGNNTMLQVVHGASHWGLSITRAANDAGSPSLVFYKTRNSNANPTAVQANDESGSITWQAPDTSNAIRVAAELGVTVAGVDANSVATVMRFHTSSLADSSPRERMRITETGNVGIGTPTPAGRLTVSGRGLYDAVGAARFDLYNTLFGGGFLQHVLDDGKWQLATTAGATRMVISNSGNVGIGTVNPSAKLDVAGTTRTEILQITGGADLSEQFEVNELSSADMTESPTLIQPGMVVSIDPNSPGELVLSSRAYDRRVAGIISGAGGIRPGMLMSQSGSVADGQHPVALTGRVYCWADASNGPINPGDLLTTSGTPGHAMRVSNHEKAQGAIIGKAMTGLPAGKELVLVLVTLQ